MHGYLLTYWRHYLIMNLWSPIKNRCYSRDASVLNIYMGEKKILGKARYAPVSGYVWPGAFHSPSVCCCKSLLLVFLTFSNTKIYKANSMYFRREKLTALKVLLVGGFYCFSCGIGVVQPGERKALGRPCCGFCILKRGL